MGLIGSIFLFFGLGLAGDVADSIGADGIVKDRAVEAAKDKAGDFAKGKAENYLSKKITNKRKSKFKEADKTDKYWYLKDNK